MKNSDILLRLDLDWRKMPLLLFGLLSACPLLSQRHDANWPFGFQEYPGNSAYGNAIVQFLPDSIHVASTDWKINFENTVGAMSDAGGNLLFTTNGCTVFNADGEAMDEITSPGVPFSIHYGPVPDLLCADYGYPAPNSIIILPSPGSDSLYVLFYMTAEYQPDKKWSYSYYNTIRIDMSANSGQGQVIQGPPPAYIPVSAEPLAAIRHGNGRDWWVMVAERNTNAYVTYLVSPENVQNYNSQKIGPVGDCPRMGSTAFSPDGRKYARTDNCRTVVFDFDRCTGLLSNPIVFDRPNYVFGGGGVAFSPNANRVFVTEQMAVLSADLTSAAPALDTLVPSTEMIGVSLGLLQAAPDGRLYSNSTHRSRFMASFRQTNDADVDFKAKSLFLDKFSARSLPYFPNYRLYDLPGSFCDTLGIDGPIVSAQEPENKDFWSISPNPASSSIQIRLSQTAPAGCRLILVNLTGLGMYSTEFPEGARETNIHLPMELPSGLYGVELRTFEQFWGVQKLYILR